jgi:AraC-like DNA-binding protein
VTLSVSHPANTVTAPHEFGPANDTRLVVLGDMTLARIDGPSQIETGSGDPDVPAILLLNCSGSCRVAQGQQTLTLGPADAVFLDGHRPYSCVKPNGELYLLPLSRSAVAGMLRDPGPSLPRCVPADAPGLALIMTYLQSDLLRGTVTSMTASVIALHLRDLVVLSLRATLAATLSRPNVQTIKRDIRANLPRHALSAEVVAQWYGLNLRALQRIFARGGGTVSSFILDERLLLARRRLEQGAGSDRIDTIARECGFNSLSHFNLAFRRKFGAAPTAIRDAGRKNTR